MLGEKSLDEILNENADINILLSDRGGHKSTDVQLFLFEKWKKREKKDLIFFLSRPKSDEVVGENWFSEYARNEIQKEGFEISSENPKNFPKAKIIKLNDKPFGIVLFASLSSKYKSNYLKGFENIEYGILEECVEENVSQNYSQALRGLLSIANTVCRKNKRQLILLGNDILIPNFTPKILDELQLFEKLEFNKIVKSRYYFFDDYKENGEYSVVCWYFGKKGKIANYFLPVGEIYELQKNDVLKTDLGYRIFINEKDEYSAVFESLNGNSQPVLYFGKTNEIFKNDKNLLEKFENEYSEILNEESKILIEILKNGSFSKSNDLKGELFEIWKKKNIKNDDVEIKEINVNLDEKTTSPVWWTSSDNRELLRLNLLSRSYPCCFSDRKIKSIITRKRDF